MAHCVRSLIRTGSGAIRGAVNQAPINAFPEHIGRECNNRLYEHSPVKLVNPVLVQNQPVDSTSAFRQLGWEVGPFVVQEPRAEESDCRSTYGNGAEHQFRAGVFVPAFAFGWKRRVLTSRHGFGSGLEDRVKEMLEVIGTAHCLGNAHPSANEGENGQQHKGNHHDHRALMWRSVSFFAVISMSVSFGGRGATAVLAKKSEEPQTKHVKRGHGSRNDTNQPQDMIATRPGPPQNLVL